VELLLRGRRSKTYGTIICVRITSFYILSFARTHGQKFATDANLFSLFRDRLAATYSIVHVHKF